MLFLLVSVNVRWKRDKPFYGSPLVGPPSRPISVVGIVPGEPKSSNGYPPGAGDDRAPTDDEPGRSQSLLFLGGLHRSGTTLVARLLGRHPDVSGFVETGAKEDEGQHLQSVYKPANAFGGEGRFGFHSEAHLTEQPPEVAGGEARRLFQQWAPHWDLRRRVLVEKSPPNLIRMRYLQSLFPHAHFAVVMRHPIEVALASRRRARRASVWGLLRHWFHCHDVFSDDAEFITRLTVVRYEDLVAEPRRSLDHLFAFVGLPPSPGALACEVTSDASARYRERWQRLSTTWSTAPYVRLLVRRFEADAERYGYTLRGLTP